MSGLMSYIVVLLHTKRNGKCSIKVSIRGVTFYPAGQGVSWRPSFESKHQISVQLNAQPYGDCWGFQVSLEHSLFK